MELRESLDAVSRPEHNVYLDAQQLAERLMGDHMASNLLLVWPTRPVRCQSRPTRSRTRSA